MFTGIIGEIGRVTSARSEGGGLRLTIDAASSASELRIDDSVSVNGVCLTVVAKAGGTFTVQAVEETLHKTTLGEFTTGRDANLELPVRLNDRLGGHLVLGHVDCVGTISAIEDRDSSRIITVGFPVEFARYVIPAGSIALDGISLTVAKLEASQVSISVIPHTLGKTTLAHAVKGMRMNIEFDLIGKYIERLVMGEKNAAQVSAITAAKLREWGYNT